MKQENNNFFLPDFALSICREKLPDNGEDSGYYCFAHRGSMVAVFDGCGGSGAKKYPGFRGKTGAYMASRVVCGATKDWFAELRLGQHAPEDTASLKSKIDSYMALCRSVGGDSGGKTIKGSMSREFPTTAALLHVCAEGRAPVVHCVWAGDSRCYLLDSHGLHQLSLDDLGVTDAMENLTADAVLTNVISASGKYTLHHAALTLREPAILFAATDGCFGYLSTPMEFEYLLLSTLAKAQSPAQWEQRLTAELEEIAGDDFTLNAMAIGLGSLSDWQGRMKGRTEELWERYIHGLAQRSAEEKTALWHEYRNEYEKYIKER